MQLRKYYQNIKNEIKLVYVPLFVMAVILITAICLLSFIYFDNGGDGHSVMEFLFMKNRRKITSYLHIYAFDIWVNGIGRWIQLLAPILVGINECYVEIERKKSKINEWQLLRQGKVNYCISKLVGVFVKCGFVMMTAYALYGVIVFSMFEVETESINHIQILYRLMGSFFYGAILGSVSMLLSIIISDVYVLLCVPILLKYIYDTFIYSLEIDAMSRNDQEALDLYRELYIESFFDAQNVGNLINEAMITVGVYILVGIIMYVTVNRRGDGVSTV